MLAQHLLGQAGALPALCRYPESAAQAADTIGPFADGFPNLRLGYTVTKANVH